MIPYLIAGIALLATGCAQTFWGRKRSGPLQPQYPIDRERIQREPDAARVEAMEGLRLSDFERTLPDLPGRQVVLETLNMIIAGRDVGFVDNAGDATRLDPLWETLRAARLFLSDVNEISYPHLWPLRITEKDLKTYQKEAQIRYWDKHRDKIKSEFNLDQVNHPFVTIFDKLPVVDLPSFRGLSSYYQLADKILSLLPALSQSQKLHVLYPASGFHVAPLMTALRLMDNGVIHEAAFIYTEIDPQNFGWLVDVLRLGLGDVFDRVAVEKKVEFSGEGSEQTIVLSYRGQPIRVVFALNRSGANYYRSDYLGWADLVVLHDPGNGAMKDSFDLLAKVLLDKQTVDSLKPQVMIMEGKRKGCPEDQFGFPPTLPQLFLPGPYGHCAGAMSVAEIEFCDFETSRAFPLHNSDLLSLAGRYSTSEDLSEILFPSHQEIEIFTTGPIPPTLEEK